MKDGKIDQETAGRVLRKLYLNKTMENSFSLVAFIISSIAIINLPSIKSFNLFARIKSLIG